MSDPIEFLKFKTAENFRYRLALSILSGKPIRISKIRIKDISNPGLKEYEANLLKLIDLITNGTNIEINPSGTSLTFIPGILLGGDQTDDVFETNPERGLGYYLEFLFLIAPFCKDRLEIKLSGITNGHDLDQSVDVYKASGMQTIRKFLHFDDHLRFDLEKRAMGEEKASVNGVITFSCPNPNKLKTISENFIGKISKIRGNAFSCRVPPQLATRVGKVVRSNFSSFMKNVFIYNEVNKCEKNAKGYGLVLVGETVNGQNENIATFTVERSAKNSEVSPEELAQEITRDFCREISRIGVVDSHFQPLACLYMTMTEQDVSSLTVGPLTKSCVDMLRLIKLFFNITFRVDASECDEFDESASEDGMSGDEEAGGTDEEESTSGSAKSLPQKTTLACVGVGFSNLVKRRI